MATVTARVCGTEVKEIINTSLLADDLDMMIVTANSIVTGKCASAGYTDIELKMIELWLAAHFVSVRDPSRSAVIEQNAGAPSQKYALIGKGLSSTPYGQQVLIMDYKGKLADVGGGKTASTIMSFGTNNADFD